MNFLITGAAGFLASSLANNLAREGHQVRGMDNLSTGDPQVLSPDIHFTRGDVSDRPKLVDTASGTWTWCIHSPARVSVSESVLYPRDYNEVNVGGTVALMEACAMSRATRRASVVGRGYAIFGEQPLRESVIPNPRSPNAVSKLAAEYYVRHDWPIVGIETVSLRIFKRLWAGSTSSGFASAGGTIFLAAGFARRERSWFTAMAIKRAIMFMWTTWSAQWWPHLQRQMWMGWSSTSARELRRAFVTCQGCFGCNRRQARGDL